MRLSTVTTTVAWTGSPNRIAGGDRLVLTTGCAAPADGATTPATKQASRRRTFTGASRRDELGVGVQPTRQRQRRPRPLRPTRSRRCRRRGRESRPGAPRRAPRSPFDAPLPRSGSGVRRPRGSPAASPTGTVTPATSGKLASQSGSWITTGMTSSPRPSARCQSCRDGGARKSDRTKRNVPGGASVRRRTTAPIALSRPSVGPSHAAASRRSTTADANTFRGGSQVCPSPVTSHQPIAARAARALAVIAATHSSTASCFETNGSPAG